MMDYQFMETVIFHVHDHGCGHGRGSGVNLPALMTHGKGYQIQNILRSKNIPPSDKNAKNAIIKIYQIMTTHQH